MTAVIDLPTLALVLAPGLLVIALVVVAVEMRSHWRDRRHAIAKARRRAGYIRGGR